MESEPHIEQITYQLTWPIRHKVMWPDHPIDFVKLPEDKDGLHYGLFEGNKLVSIISAFVLGDEAQFRKFATVIEYQGKGYGSQLLGYLMAELESQQLARIWCNARVNKTNLYEKFGLVKTDQTYVKGGLDFVIMEKKRKFFLKKNPDSLNDVSNSNVK